MFHRTFEFDFNVQDFEEFTAADTQRDRTAPDKSEGKGKDKDRLASSLSKRRVSVDAGWSVIAKSV